MNLLPKILTLFFLVFQINSLSSQIRNAPLTKIDAEKAQLNYNKYCSLCHGEDREGNAADYAPSLKSKSLMSTMPLNFLASSIAFGRPDTPMAAYVSDMGGPLSMKDIFTMSIWLKYKSGHETIALPDEAISGDLQKGLSMYSNTCAECHGKQAEGVTAPSLANPAFLAFATDAYIKYAIENGREGSEMKPYKNELTSDDMNSLTAYIRSLASGWSIEAKELAPYPEVKDYVINPKGHRPDFELIDGRYVPMAQVMKALEQKQKMVILDTRTSSEWHNAHIPGAVPIPYYITEKEVDRGLPKDDTWIIAYCACPHAASDKVIDMLRKKGYKHTAVIDEGFFLWLDAGYPVIGGTLKPEFERIDR